MMCMSAISHKLMSGEMADKDKLRRAPGCANHRGFVTRERLRCRTCCMAPQPGLKVLENTSSLPQPQLQKPQSSHRIAVMPLCFREAERKVERGSLRHSLWKSIQQERIRSV